MTAASPKTSPSALRSLSFAKTSTRGQVVDLSALIRTESELHDHPLAPRASSLPLPLRRPPPARPREPRLAPPARRVQENHDTAQAAHDGSPLLGLAGQSLGRVETAPRDRDSGHCLAMAAAPLSRVLDPTLSPADTRSPAHPRGDQGFGPAWSCPGSVDGELLSRSSPRPLRRGYRGSIPGDDRRS